MYYIFLLTFMNDSDIIEILKFLKSGIKNKDWDHIIEAQEYLEDYLEEIKEDEANY